jgi:hypothetical protein
MKQQIKYTGAWLRFFVIFSTYYKSPRNSKYKWTFRVFSKTDYMQARRKVYTAILLKTEVSWVVTRHQSTWCNNPEDLNLQVLRHHGMF